MRRKCESCATVGVVALLLFAWVRAGAEHGGPVDLPSAQYAWIDSVPLLTIGADTNDPLHRVTGAALIGDTLIIAQASANSLRFYDRRNGEFILRVGRSGEGPGEYRQISFLQRVGERLYTYDPFSRRVTIHNLSGSLERTAVLEHWRGYRFPELVGVFPDGSFLVAAEFRDYSNPATAPMLHRDVMLLGRYDSNGGFVDSLGYYLGEERYRAPTEGGGQTYGQPPPFARSSWAGVIGDGYHIVDNKDPMISVFDSAGTLLREIGPDSPPQAVRIGRADRERLATFDDVDPDDLPQYYPFYGSGTVVDGTLWVSDYVDRERDQRIQWTVYSYEGELLHRVVAEDRIRILDVDADLAIVVHYGGWNVETVELRRIVQGR